MPSLKLPNYLRTFRRRAGLSQDEVAFLLGCQSGAHVCHYERFRRVPSLRTALAFAVIFQTPIQMLYAGEFQKVEQAIRRRAKRLSARLSVANTDPSTARKVALLDAVANAPIDIPVL